MTQCPYCGQEHIVSRCPQACLTCHGGREIYVHAEEGLHAYTLHVDHHEGHLHQPRVHLRPVVCPACLGTGQARQLVVGDRWPARQQA